MNDFPWITLVTLIPLVGAVIVAGIDRESRNLARGLGLGFSLASLLAVMVIWAQFDPIAKDFQFGERHEWIPSTAVHVEYHVGVDGLGMLMVLLTGLLVPFAMVMAWGTVGNVKLCFALFLLLEAGLFGTFTALNFFHWFLFWELSLVPAFFLIRLWGGPRCVEAATQFFVYTMVGSVTLLLSFLAMYAAVGTFDFGELAAKGRSGELAAAIAARLSWPGLSSDTLMTLIFAGAFLGFAVKVPVMPFHTWLPAAYAEAPTGTVMVLTGLMSKMGVYGFLRILVPIFPGPVREFLAPLLWLVVATIVYSAFAALAQRDLKRLLGYSSINHLGYCLLGLLAAASAGGSGSAIETHKAAALSGVMLQMFNHGVTAAVLFAFVGLIELRSGGGRGIDDFGGLRQPAPVFCGLMGIAVFASLGLPGLNGFVGEFLIFQGTLALVPWAAVAAVPGLLVTAVLLLTLMQKLFHGRLKGRWSAFSDLTVSERILMFPAIVLMFALGVYPQLLLEVLNTTVGRMVDHLQF